MDKPTIASAAAKHRVVALNPEARGQMLRDLASYVKGFDKKYGTKLYDAMVRNGFPY
jgi:hypothetical protein